MGIPIGNTREEITQREVLIRNFYRQWKEKNPTQRKYNLSLKDYINIRYVSIDETSRHAAKTYLSTLAVMQLDAILTNAKKVSYSKIKPNNKNQSEFVKMIIMQYQSPGIGKVKLTVGIKRRTKEKVQYCITAVEV